MVTVLTRRPQPVADTVAQVIGGVGIPEAQVQATRLTEQFAALTGGQPLFLPTAGVVSGKALRDAMLDEPYVAQVVEAWSQLTVLLAGVGSLEPSPLLRRSGNAIAESDQEALRTLGAVGDICLRFFDAAGHHVDSDLDGRVIGIDPQTLLAVPRRVGVAGGPRKHSAIRAAMLGGWVNVLVTDVDTARVLLA